MGNYYPIALTGKYPASQSQLGSNITWDLLEEKGEDVVVGIHVFNSQKDIKNIIYVDFNTRTGKIASYYVHNLAYSPNKTGFSKRDYLVGFAVDKMAKTIVDKLVDLFRTANTVAYKKACDERKLVGFANIAADFRERKTKSEIKQIENSNNDFIIPEPKVYDVNAEKAPVYNENPKKKHHKKHVFKLLYWEVRGHYRRYKNGKVIYIKPYRKQISAT